MYTTSRLSIKCLWLMFTFIVLFFKGWFEEYTPIRDTILVALTEGCFLILFLETILHKGNFRIKFPGLWCLLGYILWTLFSGIYHNSSFFDVYRHCRYWIDLYIFIFCLLNARFSRYEIKFLLFGCSFLCLFQLPASLLNILIHGRLEKNVGTLTNGGGGPGTVFPLIAMSFALGYYFYKNKNWRQFILAMSFILVGASNGKRAICFLFPFFVVLGFFLNAYLLKSIQSAVKVSIRITLLTPILLLSGLLLLSNMMGFEELQSETTVENKFQTAYDIGFNYSSKDEVFMGYEQGRGTLFTSMVRRAIFGYDDYWFGVGPMSAIGNTDRGAILSGAVNLAYSKYGVGYGAGGWIYDALSIGMPGMIMNVLFYVLTFVGLFRRVAFHSLNPTGKALYFGVLLSISSMLFTHFIYNSLLSNSVFYQIMPIGVATLLTSNYYREQNFEML